MRTRISAAPTRRSAEPLEPAMEFIQSRHVLWIPGLRPSVSLKEDDTLWIVGGASIPAAISLSRLGRLIPALSKRHGREEAYRLSLDQASIHLSGPVETTYALHAVLQKKYTAAIRSLIAIVMAEAWRRDPRVFGRWMKAEWDGRVGFVSAKPLGAELMASLVKESRTSVVLIENHGVLLQSDGELFETGCLGRWADLELAFCRRFGHPLLESILLGAVPLLGPTNYRTFFQESRLLEPRIKGVTEGESLRTLKPNAWRFDFQAAQHFRAIQILSAASPNLKEFES